MGSVRNLASALIAAFFCFAANAEIVKVEGNRIELRLNGKTVSIGEQLDVVDTGGDKQGIIRVTSFNATSAYAEIESGFAQVGMRVARRIGATVKREFRNTNKYYNFRVNPIGLVAGGIDANFDFRITENMTLGPQGIYLHATLSPSGIFNSDYDITAYGFGARANWFFNGVFKDGFYFGPSVEYLTVTLKTTDVFGAATGTASGVMASGLIGYGWFWENFNIMLGGGYASVFGTSGITIKDSVGNQETITANLSGLTYELSAGWAF